MNEDKVCLICGCSRSGTTWMYNLLKHYNNLGVGEFGLGQLCRMREGQTSGKEGWNPLNSKIKTQSVNYVLDKTPANIYDTRSICSIYPNSKFLFMLRDPRAVVSSMLDAKWAHKNASFDVEAASQMWLNALVEMEKTTQWAGERLVVKKYEDLWNNPEIELKGTLIWLGIDFDKESIESTVRLNSFESISLKNKTGKNNFYRYGKIDSWKAELTPDQVDKINSITFHKIHQYNYEL